MADLVRCVDRWRREIVLTVERWNDHILPAHPAMAGNERFVELTVAAPDFVNFDARHPYRENYYRASVLPAPEHRVYLKVVVEFLPHASSGILVGEVVTAFPDRRVKRTEERKWPS